MKAGHAHDSVPSAVSQFRSILQRRFVQSRVPPLQKLLTPRYCSRAFASLGDEGDYSGQYSTAELIRYPLPQGISGDKFGLYELLDSSKDFGSVEGENAVMAVHGPEEQCAPRGLEEHGAAGGIFAVIATSGTQYKVMPDDVLYTNRIKAEVNEQVTFDSVMLVGTLDWSVFGRPLIREAKVIATVEEQARSGKIHVIKFKKRKGYRRRQGHRQPITRFRINEIQYSLPDASMIRPYEVPFDPKRPPLPNHRRRI